MRGRVTAFEPGRKLGFTWKWDHDPENAPPREVVVTFLQHGDGGSKAHIMHGPYAATRKEQDIRDEYMSGWDYFLRKLQKLTE